ncbi:CD48 antigen-like [Carassius auratus]|uniref:CD48 antigen-like n=1 Tax=Carassius auratus TaxID=7957 RepID=A0A6P6NN45_CARAU|nr:CD48 antigen-like [Carassius auratus]
MIRTLVLHFLLYLFGVFDDVESYEVKSVSVMEGESVTLHTDITEIQRDDEIEWRFNSIRIATADIPEYENAERFRDRLKLDQTGSLTITDTRTTDSGDYKVSTTIKNTESIKRFSLTVYAPVSVPVITSDILQCCSSAESSSSPKCVLLCSVMNIIHVTLSWYKGNSLLSNISALEKKCVSDLSISLSLPLELEYQDNNTYSCVINNPVSNKTRHVCVTDLCRLCSVRPSTPTITPQNPSSSDSAADSVPLTVLISAAAAGFLLIGVAVVIFCICWKKRPEQEDQTRGEEITYADPTFYKRNAQKVKEEDEVVYVGVVTRR